MRQRQAAVCMFVPTPIKVIEASTKEAKKPRSMLMISIKNHPFIAITK